jgi:SAM-dependent methyltransferase
VTSANGIPGDGLTAGATGSARVRGEFAPDGQERHATDSGRMDAALGKVRGLAPAQARTRGRRPGVGVNDASVMGAKNLAGMIRTDLFVRHTHDYVTGRAGQPIAILHAGCATASDLGSEHLPADVSVSLVDDDQPVTRAAVAARNGLGHAVLGDLRTVPLPPRAFDIIQCSSLMERMRNAELVLDRLIAAAKPGGLLLLRFCDRDSAAGFLERVLPAAVRRAVWRRRRPGEPGPYPAVFEPVVSERGLQSYALLRGLVISERLALGGMAGGMPAGPALFLAAQRLVAWLSRGRLTAAHEELCYVLRKPENRFARIL